VEVWDHQVLLHGHWCPWTPWLHQEHDHGYLPGWLCCPYHWFHHRWFWGWYLQGWTDPWACSPCFHSWSQADDLLLQQGIIPGIPISLWFMIWDALKYTCPQSSFIHFAFCVVRILLLCFHDNDSIIVCDLCTESIVVCDKCLMLLLINHVFRTYLWIVPVHKYWITLSDRCAGRFFYIISCSTVLSNVLMLLEYLKCMQNSSTSIASFNCLRVIDIITHVLSFNNRMWHTWWGPYLYLL